MPTPELPLVVTTPLGADVLLATGFSGTEGLSQLFQFRVEVVARNSQAVAFDKLLGQKVAVSLTLPNDAVRYFHGHCRRVGQGEQDSTYTAYHLDVVPQLWFLTKQAQSRIFQQLSVPDILKQVFTGLTVAYQLQGAYEPRDYCVQYRETDFQFASRLMEEEGIFYYFQHAQDGHKLVVGDNPQAHASLDPATILYEQMQGGVRKETRVFTWEKTQELRTGKFTLWDHSFELPGRHLEASKVLPETVQVGTVAHALKVGNNGALEVYDYPGGYAGRFDGIDSGGGDQASEVQKIFTDNDRTTALRAAQEAAESIVLRGSGNCRHFVSGHAFTLDRHPHGNGKYVLTEVRHTARMVDYRSDGDAFDYTNTFTCVPFAAPYRPARTTPRPTVKGSQTAVVVGPPGEEIFTDKYARVKVQFPWDRAGQHDQNSSCWVRVASTWAGKGWGFLQIPRIGQEVIVDFLEGDPDQPIVTGSVYNAEQMPAYTLPDEKTKSGLKTNTSPGGAGFNELRFEDRKDKEQIFLHAERNLDVRVKNDAMEQVLHDRHLIVGTKDKPGNQVEQVFGEKHLHVMKHQVEQIEGNLTLTVGKGSADGGNVELLIEKKLTEEIGTDHHCNVKGGRTDQVAKDQNLTVTGAQNESIGKAYGLKVGADRMEDVGGDQSLKIAKNQNEKVGMSHALDAGMAIHLKAGTTLVLEAGAQLTLKVGGNFIDIGPAGVAIVGTMVMINSGGGPGAGAGANPVAPTAPTAPDAPAQAAPKDPVEADDAQTGTKSAP